eukprot:TRINITY_DN1549_c0_g1_i1.p1 TRINITY_DN1549_c0_g1~~TRINITY_DN1549_c0_g1_i1.p1  ORF type:complete len:781 (+),score=158.83 TRINITY_DN1549_c0_g1_i1:100-2442(+)
MKFETYLAYYATRHPLLQPHVFRYRHFKERLKSLQSFLASSLSRTDLLHTTPQEDDNFLVQTSALGLTNDGINFGLVLTELSEQIGDEIVRVNLFLGESLLALDEIHALLEESKDSVGGGKEKKEECIRLYRELEMLHNFITLNSIAWKKTRMRFSTALEAAFKLERSRKSSIELVGDEQSLKSIEKLMEHGLHRRVAEEIIPFRRRVSESLSNIERTVALRWCDGDVRPAQKMLRIPVHVTRPHHVFLLAFFLGMDVFFLLLLLIFVFTPPFLDNTFFIQIFPVFRCLFLFIVYFWLWALCLFIWEKYRINHVFLLGLNPDRTLSWVTVLKSSVILSFVWLAGTSLYIGTYTEQLVLIHRGWENTILLVTVVLICGLCLIPVHGFFHWSSRSTILKVLLRLLITPFGRLKLFEVFSAEQLTSVAVALRDFVFLSCFFATGMWRHPYHDHRCDAAVTIGGPVIIGIPLLWRTLQCVRKSCSSSSFFCCHCCTNGSEHGNGSESGASTPHVFHHPRRHSYHLINAFKYLASIFVIISSTFAQHGASGPQKILFTILWWILSPMVAILSWFWDVHVDWGHPLTLSLCNQIHPQHQSHASIVELKKPPPFGSEEDLRRSASEGTPLLVSRTPSVYVQPKTRPPLLRAKRLYAWKPMYYIAIVLDFFFRFVWVWTISTSMGIVPHSYAPSLLGVVELFRRGMWNVFFMENEMVSSSEAEHKGLLLPEVVEGSDEATTYIESLEGEGHEKDFLDLLTEEKHHFEDSLRREASVVRKRHHKQTPQR